MNTENVLFKRGDVTVTNSRFIVGSQTYAIRNITSVKVEKLDSNEQQPGLWIFLGVIGVLFGAFDKSWTIVLGGLAVAAFGAYSTLNRKKMIYSVVLTTASGEVKACTSEDGKHIGSIVKGLNDAIAALA
jgi:hypothetical protein